MFPASGTSYLLGKSTTATAHYMTGSLDDVRLYGRALTEMELSSLYADEYWRHRSVDDWDGDGVPNDGNGSTVIGDSLCPDGVVIGCDDSDPLWPNVLQHNQDWPGGDCTWDVVGCDPPLEAADSGHLYWYCPVPQTATEAYAFCVADGLQLVTISDAAENAVVRDTAMDDIWIGVTDLETEGTWLWVTGEEVTWDNWENGQPDDQFNDEDCGVMYSFSGAWNDRYCELSHDFVCEYSY